MKLLMSKEEMLKVLYSSLCNGGLTDLYHCGVELQLGKEYDKAKARIKKRQAKAKTEDTICYEDVLVELLRGGDKLTFSDANDETTVGFTLDEAIERLSAEEFGKEIFETVNEQDDACTGFSLLQGAIYGEVIYG
jgi:hypothetical protein